MALTDMTQALKALADPTRLRIFVTLMQGIQCNCELSGGLDLSLSLISHHLRILRQVGLVDAVRDENDGRWIYYSINQERLDEIAGALAQLLDSRQIQPRQPTCGPVRRP